MYICRQADISRPTLSTRHWQKNLLNLNAELAEVLLIPHVLVSVPGLVEGEDLLVDDGLDVVGFDGAVHLFELQPAADQDASFLSINYIQNLNLFRFSLTDRFGYALLFVLSHFSTRYNLVCTNLFLTNKVQGQVS